MTEHISFKADVTAEGRRIRGFVKLAGERTRRGGEWLEVDPAAIVKADASGVVGLWEHDPLKILGRPSNGTLSLTRTDQGIEYELSSLPHTVYADDALELVQGGFVTGSSFGIEGPFRYSFSADPVTGDRVRRITHIARLTDVSPVSDPAFSASSAQAFSKEYDMDPTTVEPTAPVAPAPVITPAPPKDEKSDTYRTAEKFARDRATLDELGSAIDNLLSGEMTPANVEAYSAMASVYDERNKAEAAAKDQLERIRLAQNMRLGRVPKAPEQSETFASDDYQDAFNRYLGKYGRPGDAAGLEQFAQSIAGDGTQGGYTVPDGFLRRITERLKAYGGIAGIADEIITSTGESLRWPYVDDTANSAAIVAEGVAGTAGADKVFSSITLGAFSYDANGAGNVPLKISLELLQDSAFDLESFIARNLSQRIGRKQASDLANGTGTTMPFGLFSKAADVMTATVVSLAAPEHIFQVDSAYRDDGNCRWVMSDTTLAKVWTSQTTTNQPLFIPGGSDIIGRPGGTLYGFPITIDAAAGTKVAFGDIKAGYIVRRVRGVQLLVDPYTAQGTRQVAYHAWARMDANIQDAYAYSVSEWSTVSADT